MLYRAIETFTTNVDGQEVFISDGRAYNDTNKKYKQVIERFPDWFEAEEPAKASR